MKNEEYLNPADGLIYCSKCGNPRQMLLEGLPGLMSPIRIPCACEEALQKEQADARMEDERRTRIEYLRRRGIPSTLYHQYTFAKDQGLVPEIQYAKSYVDHFREMEKSATGLLFWGDVGTGKTYLAACIANALIDLEIPVKMTSIPQIMNHMSGLFSEDRNRFLEELTKPSLLIIDDLGSERSTEYSLEQIYAVIDSRYSSGKPMILTTNLTLEEMENPGDRSHARIYSRILERCVPVLINGSDLRKRNAEKQFQEAKAILGSGM